MMYVADFVVVCYVVVQVLWDKYCIAEQFAVQKIKLAQKCKT